VSNPPPAPPHASLPPALFEGIPKVDEEILGGKYKVDRVIGVGGMGVVVSALHKQLGHRVAFKFLLPTMRTEEFTDRFLREGRAAAKIQSEHIARVIDADVLPNGTPYLMMEYLHGADLADYLQEQGAVPVQDAVDFVLQTLEALATAHSVGVVHRDLKPSNLFIARRPDGSSLVKVLDFGISKLAPFGEGEQKMSLTRPGTLLGSPMYMSPEQLRNAKDADHRADIWAIGIVLHELITGKPIFVSDTFPGLCAMIVGEDALPLREIVPEAPEEIEAIILRCVEKNPKDRWSSAAELAQELAPFASPEMAGLVARVTKMGRASLPGNTLASAVDVPHKKTPVMRTPSGRKTPADRRTPSRRTPASGRHPSQLDATEPATETVREQTSTPGALGNLAVSTAKEPERSRAKILAVLVASALAVGGAAFVVARQRTNEGPPAATAPNAPNATTTGFAAPSAPPAPALAESIVPPSSPAAPPPASAYVEPPPVTPMKKPAVPPTPLARPKPPAAASASAAKPPSEGDLLQDRR
jgi:serine/threonine-protein kinase